VSQSNTLAAHALGPLRGSRSAAFPESALASTVIPIRQSAVASSLKQAAYDHLPLASLCINDSGQILAINAAAGALIGAPLADAVGRHVSEFLRFRSARDPAHRWTRLWARLWARLQSGGPATLPIQVARNDGVRLALEVSAETLRFENDNVAALTISEISERRTQARVVRTRMAKDAALIPPANGLAMLIGADRRVVDTSALPEWLGMRKDEIVGVPFDLLLDERSGAEFRALVERFTESGSGSSSCTWRLRAGGDAAAARWMRANASNRLNDPYLRAIVLHGENATDAALLQARAQLLERRLLALAERSNDLLMLLDADGVVRYQSPAIRQTLGLAPESTVGQHISELATAEDQHVVTALLREAQADAGGAKSHSDRVQAIGADGVERALWLSLRNCAGEANLGGVLATAVQLHDGVASRPLAQARETRRLRFRERLFELAIQTRSEFGQSLGQTLQCCVEALGASSASYWRYENEPEEIRCEARFDASKNRVSGDWIGASLSAAAFPDFFAELRARRPVVIPDIRASAILQTASGSGRWAAMQSTLDAPVLLDGRVHGVLRVQQLQPRAWTEDEIDFVVTAALLVALAIQAAQRQDAEGRIEQLAWYDSLTGLANRNLLRETMRDMLMTAANRDRRIAVMLIDLDRFKDVNDALGHMVGDALIKSAAQALKETVGEAGVVARLGGDEFVVLVEQFEHRQEVALLAGRIANALHRTDFVPQIDTQVSASIGVALFPEHGREISTLLKNADAAMYQAKRDGRNQFSFFNPIRAERAALEVQLGIQLLKALQADVPQFVVEYQPQVEMATGRVIGLEALIRWNHPALGMLAPDRFIGVAEVSGLSERVTRWVVNEVCAQIVRWRQQREGFDIPVAINVAGREMGSAALPQIVRAALGKHAVEPRMITLEITERTLVRASEVNNDVMTELASLGVNLVLDDFGTGYSMLGYLKRMPISALKIDQSFVNGVPQDADSCAIVLAMLAVARHFKLKVVAEGVESAEQVAYLRSIGCDSAQGYFYCRPLAAEAIVDHVEIPAEPDFGKDSNR